MLYYTALEIDAYVQRYALLVVLARNYDDDDCCSDTLHECLMKPMQNRS